MKKKNKKSTGRAQWQPGSPERKIHFWARSVISETEEKTLEQ